MKKISRDELKALFKKVKHFRLPENIDKVIFDNLFYFSWIDETDKVLYTVAEINGEIKGIKWELMRFGASGVKLGLCDICHAHKPLGEILLVTAKTKHLPKGIDYRTRGFYICSDYIECNAEIDSMCKIKELFNKIDA